MGPICPPQMARAEVGERVHGGSWTQSGRLMECKSKRHRQLGDRILCLVMPCVWGLSAGARRMTPR